MSTSLKPDDSNASLDASVEEIERAVNTFPHTAFPEHPFPVERHILIGLLSERKKMRAALQRMVDCADDLARDVGLERIEAEPGSALEQARAALPEPPKP